jgi:hypothetical protein
MALIKTYPLPSGATAHYFRVAGLRLDVDARRAEMKVAGYASEQVRASSNVALDWRDVVITDDAFDAFLDSIGAALYEAAKANEPFFADAQSDV